MERLSVNINDESAEILRRVKRERGVTTTEAIRRAIGLLGYFEETRSAQSKIWIEDADGHRTTVNII